MVNLDTDFDLPIITGQVVVTMLHFADKQPKQPRVKLPLRIPRACQRLSLHPAVDWQQLRYIGSLSNLTHLKLQLTEERHKHFADPQHVDFVRSLAFLPKLQVLKLAGLRVPSEITGDSSQCAELVCLKVSTFMRRGHIWHFEQCHQLTALKLFLSDLFTFTPSKVLLPPGHNALRRLTLKTKVTLHQGDHVYDNETECDDGPILPAEYQALKGLEAACLARDVPLRRRYPSYWPAPLWMWNFYDPNCVASSFLYKFAEGITCDDNVSDSAFD